MASKNWLSSPAVSGLPTFARIPPVVFLDPHLSSRALRVFCLLCAHANAEGYCTPSLDRLAEMCGYYTTKDGIKSPHRSLVSTLIGELVSRGYVVRHGQRGFNKTQLTQLLVSPVAVSQANPFADRQRADYDGSTATSELAQRDAFLKAEGYTDLDDCLDAMNGEGRHATSSLGELAGSPVVLAELPDASDLDSDGYTEADVLSALRDYDDGLDLDIPADIVRAHGYKFPRPRQDSSLPPPRA